MSSRKERTFNTCYTAELYNRLQATAKQKEVPAGWIVRTAVKQYLDSQSALPNKAQAIY